jgi:hypothetical protein
MPGVIDQFLFPPVTVIPPGEFLESDIIDVSGVQYLSVNMEVGGEEAEPITDVERRILFGRDKPDDGHGFLALHTDTFGPSGELMTFTPVHGPRLFVTVQNNSNQRAFLHWATVYGIREVP